jgi:hypothetical protein
MLAIVRPSPANNKASLQVWHKYDATNQVTEFTTLDALNTGTGFFSNVISTGSPFDTSSFGTGKLEHRCVGWSLRVRNTSSPIYTAGTSIGYAGTDGALGGTMTASTVASLRSSKVVSMKEALSLPMRFNDSRDNFADHAQWNSTDVLDGITGAYAGGAINGIGIAFLPNQAGAAVNMFATFELIAHWEVRGRTVDNIGTINPTPAPATSESVFNYGISAMRFAVDKIPPEAVVRAMMALVASRASGRYLMN